MSQPTDKFSISQPNELQRPEALQSGEPNPRTKQPVNNSDKIFLRLPRLYIPFYQAMAEDYYQRGRISQPSIGLFAKKCLLMAGNSWDRMIIQLRNLDYEREEIEQERRQNREYLTPTSEYQQQRQDWERKVEEDLKRARIISEHFSNEF
jgi:hypothetical protein